MTASTPQYSFRLPLKDDSATPQKRADAHSKIFSVESSHSVMERWKNLLFTFSLKTRKNIKFRFFSQKNGIRRNRSAADGKILVSTRSSRVEIELASRYISRTLELKGPFILAFFGGTERNANQRNVTERKGNFRSVRLEVTVGRFPQLQFVVACSFRFYTFIVSNREPKSYHGSWSSISCGIEFTDGLPNV
uniref:Uncharacterized protein n=1 Tax=Romanomermis culicivorax TaxID=13658 RepID=A0A915IPD8_ROMCU